MNKNQKNTIEKLEKKKFSKENLCDVKGGWQIFPPTYDPWENDEGPTIPDPIPYPDPTPSEGGC